MTPPGESVNGLLWLECWLDGMPGFLGDADFGVRAVHLAQRFADLAHGGVGADCIHDERHGVGRRYVAVQAGLWLERRNLLERFQRALNLFIRAAGAQSLQLR